MAQLSVNIDHVATVRQARRTYEPDPIWAAVAAQLGGADGITFHLREDRRHIQDKDVYRLAEAVTVKLNFELAATEEMIAIASEVRPQLAMLVPEGRAEITTEGGLDVAGQRERLQAIVNRLNDSEVLVSAFIDAEEKQIDAAAACGFAVCEVHTGPYAHAFYEHGRDVARPEVEDELKKIRRAGELICERGMRFNAGHALNYANVGAVAALPDVAELHIGHAIVSRAVFVGLREAVVEMKRLLQWTEGC